MKRGFAQAAFFPIQMQDCLGKICEDTWRARLGLHRLTFTRPSCRSVRLDPVSMALTECFGKHPTFWSEAKGPSPRSVDGAFFMADAREPCATQPSRPAPPALALPRDDGAPPCYRRRSEPGRGARAPDQCAQHAWI